MLPVASALQRRPTTRDVPLNVNSQLSGETGSLDLQHNAYFRGGTTSAKVDFKLLMGCIECGVGKRRWWGQLQQAAAGSEEARGLPWRFIGLDSASAAGTAGSSQGTKVRCTTWCVQKKKRTAEAHLIFLFYQILLQILRGVGQSQCEILISQFN